MIDTVVTILEEGSFTITKPEAFDPPAYWFTHKASFGNFYQRSKMYAAQKELKKDIYKPRLTLFKGFSQKGIRKNMLKIETSLPNLKNQNNLIELTNADLPIIIDKLQSSLEEMGVSVYGKDLANASISTIHYAKNILLPENMTTNQIIKEFSKGNYMLTLDAENEKFRNGGQLFKLHANSWEIAIYDKVKDLKKAVISPKRSEEKNSLIQLHFLDEISPSFEVLRIEIRLNKKKLIKSLLKKLNINTEITLKGLFDKQIAQKVLLHYLDKLKEARPEILNYEINNEKELLPGIIKNNPNLTLRNKIMFYGLLQALKTHDIREIKEILHDEKNKRSWYRILNESKKLVIPKGENLFPFLESQLMEFEPLKIDQFQENYYEYT